MTTNEKIWKEYKEYDDLEHFDVSFGKYLKTKYSKEELKKFYIWLRKEHPWSYACLNNKTGTEVWYYRGYWVGVIKMQSKKLECGLSDHTNSWLFTGQLRRPTEVYQVEILKKGSGLYDGEVLYYGYVENKMNTIKAMLDKIIKTLPQIQR